MAIVVQKYGGSSVATVEKIKSIAQRVVQRKREGYDVVVVVSAMGDTTDELLALAQQISEVGHRRELDMLLTAGERISMALLSMAIHSHGLDAISFTGSQSGIITTASHSGARIVEVRPYRIQDELESGRIVIVAGYQGVSYKREVTTLGRGGSDTTAVALAAALGAEACEIYSDVDGVFDTDPRVVEDARKLDELSYEEMQELSRLGARVLNATAVEYARNAGIALYARTAHGSGSGTTIHGGGGFRRVDGFEEAMAAAERDLGVRAVSGIEEGLLLELPPSADSTALNALLDVTRDVASPVLHVEPNRGRATVLLNLENVHDVSVLRGELTSRCKDLVQTPGMGLVAAVGRGVGDKPRALAAVLTALSEQDLTPQHVQASSLAIACVLPAEAVADGMRAVHGHLVATS